MIYATYNVERGKEGIERNDLGYILKLFKSHLIMTTDVGNCPLIIRRDKLGH
jgi:hypothetical protein